MLFAVSIIDNFSINSNLTFTLAVFTLYFTSTVTGMAFSIARAMADRTGLSTAMTGRTFDGAFTATVLTNGTTTAMTVFTSGFTNSIDTVKTDDLTREGF